MLKSLKAFIAQHELAATVLKCLLLHLINFPRSSPKAAQKIIVNQKSAVDISRWREVDF